MSYYRVCKIENAQHKLIESKKFDDKEDAEHYAKNQSMGDEKYSYEIMKNEQGDFVTIKTYLNGVDK